MECNIEDLRKLAKRRLPVPIYDYIDSGSYEEITKSANVSDFDAIKLRPRVMIDVDKRDQTTAILRQQSAMPIVISPVGLSGILAGGGRGEILAARAARSAGIPFGLSMLSAASMEEVRTEADYPFWLHVMPLKDRGLMQAMIDRAHALGCPALIVTVDWQVPAQIHNNLRNRLGQRPTAKVLGHYLAKPRWLLSMLTSGRPLSPGNFREHGAAAASKDDISTILDPSATWDYVEWIRKRWAGPMLVKGIIDPDDAEAAVRSGADAISVSNHGGTQLDGASSAIAALPYVVDRVAGRCEVFMDSGVRRGHDVIKALALGATACLVGRPYLFGLAANGEAGVTQAIAILRNEIDSAMALTGCRTIADVHGRAILQKNRRPNPDPASVASRQGG